MLKCNELKNKWFLELIAFILISKSSQLITPWDTEWPFELSSNKNLDMEILEQIKPLNYLLFIHYFRIDHNHLVYPPEFCITIVSNYSWVLQSSQEKSKTMVMQSFGGLNTVHYGLWHVKMVN